MANYSKNRGHMPKGKKLGKQPYRPRPNSLGNKSHVGQPWTTNLKVGRDGRRYNRTHEDVLKQRAKTARERYWRNKK